MLGISGSRNQKVSVSDDTCAVNNFASRNTEIDTCMATMAFDKSRRLLNASDYKKVFDNAPYRASHQHLLILSRSNQISKPRLGLVIAKKHIRLAVQRNRIKRILRETFRLQQNNLESLDFVVLARKGLDELDNEQLHKLFNKQWNKISKKAALLIKDEKQSSA